MAALSGLQCRFDHASHADGNFVLKLENVLQRAFDAIGPEVSAGYRVDKWFCNADPLARLTD